MILSRKPVPTFRDHAETYMIAPTAGRCKRPLINTAAGTADCRDLRNPGVTGSLEESYCCPTSAHRPPRCLAKRKSCVGPVLSVPDSSAPSPPGPSGSGLFAGELIPVLGQRKLVLFLFWAVVLDRSPPARINTAPLPIRSGNFQQNQCSVVNAAPSIGPGLSRLPSWTYTTAASTPSREIFSSGTVQLPELPFQSPTLSRLRTTLW